MQETAEGHDLPTGADAFNEAIESLWTDLEPGGDLRESQPLVAHYTSISTIEKILTNEEIWFSHPFYMNDTQELWHNMGLCQKALEEECSHVQNDPLSQQAMDQIKLLRYAFHEIVKFYEQNYFQDIYVFCASEHRKDDDDGLLSMWRGYGESGSGAAIVFDTGKFAKDENSPFVVRKVTYQDDAWRENWIKEKINSYLQRLAQLQLADTQVVAASDALLQRFMSFALFTKHPGYIEENEWRVAYIGYLDRDKVFSPMFSYFSGPRGIEPKLKLDFENFAKLAAKPGTEPLVFAATVDRIIVGPSAGGPYAVESMKRMLSAIGKEQINVVPSRIPFRRTST
jgi:Protein of unknown function (DUF2971)